MRKPVPADDPAVTDSVLTESYKVRLMVLPVRVCGDVTNFVDTYAFLDAGSEMSFCTIFYLQANILVGKSCRCFASVMGRFDHNMAGLENSLATEGCIEPCTENYRHLIV